MLSQVLFHISSKFFCSVPAAVPTSAFVIWMSQREYTLWSPVAGLRLNYRPMMHSLARYTRAPLTKLLFCMQRAYVVYKHIITSFAAYVAGLIADNIRVR